MPRGRVAGLESQRGFVEEVTFTYASRLVGGSLARQSRAECCRQSMCQGPEVEEEVGREVQCGRNSG